MLTLTVESEEYGGDDYDFNTRAEMLDGLCRLLLCGLDQGDGIRRFYSVVETEEDGDTCREHHLRRPCRICGILERERKDDEKKENA